MHSVRSRPSPMRSRNRTVVLALRRAEAPGQRLTLTGAHPNGELHPCLHCSQDCNKARSDTQTSPQQNNDGNRSATALTDATAAGVRQFQRRKGLSFDSQESAHPHGRGFVDRRSGHGPDGQRGGDDRHRQRRRFTRRSRFHTRRAADGSVDERLRQQVLGPRDLWGRGIRCRYRSDHGSDRRLRCLGRAAHAGSGQRVQLVLPDPLGSHRDGHRVPSRWCPQAQAVGPGRGSGSTSGRSRSGTTRGSRS